MPCRFAELRGSQCRFLGFGKFFLCPSPRLHEALRHGRVAGPSRMSCSSCWALRELKLWKPRPPSFSPSSLATHKRQLFRALVRSARGAGEGGMGGTGGGGGKIFLVRVGGRVSVAHEKIVRCGVRLTTKIVRWVRERRGGIQAFWKGRPWQTVDS